MCSLHNIKSCLVGLGADKYKKYVIWFSGECVHIMVHRYFKAFILTCPVLGVAYKCKDFETFKRSECLNCSSPGNCVHVGIRATKKEIRGNPPGAKYLMWTTGSHPFCGKETLFFWQLYWATFHCKKGKLLPHIRFRRIHFSLLF